MIHTVCAILNELYALTDCSLAFECDTPWKKFLTPWYKVTIFRFVISFFSFNWISIKYSVEIRVPIDEIKCTLVVFANRHSLITHYEIGDYKSVCTSMSMVWWSYSCLKSARDGYITYYLCCIRFKCLIWQDNVNLLK